MPQIINGVGRAGVRVSTATPQVSYDTDAQAFITAAALTDTTQKNAINDLVLDLKAAGVWTKMKALYPMVGGTATTHKFNLKDPRDLDAAYRLTFTGGGTHSANGYQPNGSNAYGDTFLTPSTALSLNSTHISFYSRTDNNGSWDMGCYVASPSTRRLQILCKLINTTYYGVNSSTESSISNTNGTGLYIANRTSSTIHQLIKNNTINSTTVSSVGLPTRTVFIGGGNLDGGNLYGSKQCAFASIGDGLTDLESNLFYQIVEKYQYALGRNVNANQTFYFNRNYSNETNAFIFNGAISDATQQSAINTLVNDLKAAGIWTKMKALYPMVGGTALAHKFNLVNPINAASAYALTFNGGWTHSSTGALPNGSTGYATMGSLNMNTLNTADVSVGFYSRTNVGLGVYYDMGATNNVDTGWFILNPRNGVNQINYQEGSSNFLISNNDSRGFYHTSTTATNVHKVFKNGIVVGSNTTTQAKTPFNSLMYLGAAVITTGGFYYSAREQAFSYVSNGLTDLESNLFYQIVEKFQYTLGRNINPTQPFYYNSSYTNETNAFIFNGAVTDATQISAVDTLVTTLKTAGIWTKMKAVYPMVGGTALAHKFNLVNPIDSTSAYALTFNGGWTHSSTGALPNGTTAYANTFLTPSTTLSLNSTHLSYYSRSILESGVDMGCQIVGASTYLYCRDIGGYTFARVNTWGSGTDTVVSNTNGTGLYISNRNSSTVQSAIKNNIITNSNINSANRPNVSIYIGAINNPTIYYGKKECAFSSIGDGLTDAEATTFYNAVQAFQTTLGRQV